MPLCYAMLCALVCQLFWPFCFNMFVGRRKVYTMHNSLKITATNVENPKINFTSKKQENSSTPSSNAKKVALCGLGVLGTIGATLFAIRRGKASKEIRIGIEEFKQAGNFFKEMRILSFYSNFSCFVIVDRIQCAIFFCKTNMP